MEIQRVVEECNSPAVAGVLLYATEMAEHDFDKGLRAIRKPMVIFDYDAGNPWPWISLIAGQYQLPLFS